MVYGLLNLYMIIIKKIIFLKPFLLLIICSAQISEVVSQSIIKPVYDTTFYKTYPSSFIVRIFVSRKYAGLQLSSDKNIPVIDYRPNTHSAIGIGATYRGLTLNVAYGGIDFLNTDTEKGTTKKLDVQVRLYTRKWAVDASGQSYKGYYLYPKGLGLTDNKSYYIRPDLHVSVAGVSAYRLFNYKRFTLRPAFVNDEQQIKSAGSFLAGAELFYVKGRGDSSLVPTVLASLYQRNKIQHVQFIAIGPGAGYAYTQVLPFHLFVTGALTLHVNLGHAREYGPGTNSYNISANANLFYRLAAGYDNGNTIINFFWLNNKISANGALNNYRYGLNTGNFRFIIAKRFQPGPRSKKMLRYVDRYFE